MDKDKIKKAKKILRFRHDNKTFYKFDRFLKLTTIKIEKLEPTSSIHGGNTYRVKYKYGVNVFNPLSLILVVVVLIGSIIQSAYEVVKEFSEDPILNKYSSTIKIKDKEKEIDETKI